MRSHFIPSPSRVATSSLYLALAAISGVAAAIAASRSEYMRVALAAAAAAALVFCAIRSAQSGVEVTARHLTARRELATARLSWEDVARFEVRPLRGLGAIRLDGSWTKLLHAPVGHSVELEAVANRLNSELAYRRKSREE